ncbi:MAG: galactose-1-phosphate uridylyltransferase [Candidatus Omnitrophota bacterium]
MTELRRDPVVGRWVIMNVDNPLTPRDIHTPSHYYEETSNCPFCFGNEYMTPPEIQAFRSPKTQPNSAGWQVRVVPNKFPALQIEGKLDKRGMGIFDLSNGIGAHEVIIETPYHSKDLPDLDQAEVESVLRMYCQRSRDLQKDKRFKYIMIFKNYGTAAGATLDHNHSQLIALPMIPKNVIEELTGSGEYYDFRERCIFCDIIRQELDEQERVLMENDDFIVFCPYASRFPFEMWLMPKEHQLFFPESSDEQLSSMARILKESLMRMKKALNDPPYNFIIHTSPVDGEERQGYHWHMEIMPRLSRVAGFEWGTGFYVVPTPPEVAIKYLKEAVL